MMFCVTRKYFFINRKHLISLFFYSTNYFKLFNDNIRFPFHQFSNNFFLHMLLQLFECDLTHVFYNFDMNFLCKNVMLYCIFTFRKKTLESPSLSAKMNTFSTIIFCMHKRLFKARLIFLVFPNSGSMDYLLGPTFIAHVIRYGRYRRIQVVR